VTSDPSPHRPGGAEPTLALPGRFRAVVFDLDGVLVDTEPGWRRAETELLRRHGDGYTDADAAASLGSSMDDVVARYATRLGLVGTDVARLRDELMELARAEYAAVTLLPGARELVRALHGRIPLGVASNTPRELVFQAIDATGLRDYLDVVVTAEDVARPKPAPDMYLAACTGLGVGPSEAVAIEDSSPGLLAAHRAGMTVVAIPGGPDVDTTSADHAVSAITEIRVDPSLESLHAPP
jgi:HAD superfamily hydrolase (TIGR01509 family)